MTILGSVTWLKLAAFGVVALALAGLGFYAGTRWDAAEVAKRDATIATLNASVGTLRGGLDRCNASVNGYLQASNAATARANKALDALKAQQGDLDAARKRLAAVPRSGAACPSIKAIFDGAFKP